MEKKIEVSNEFLNDLLKVIDDLQNSTNELAAEAEDKEWEASNNLAQVKTNIDSTLDYMKYKINQIQEQDDEDD